MSSRSSESETLVPLPRDTAVLYGHRDAEHTLLEAYRGGRIAHAWLIAGPAGIGKATLAYRMARFVLANPDPASPRVQAATSLDVDPTEPAARQFAAGTHGGLLVLERTANDKGVLRTVITVEEARETVAFFGSTPSAGGWRVCIIDSVDELNASSSNALLKVIEEPPPRALFLLVSTSPARVLPTITSRCRKLKLRPLPEADVIAAAAAATGLAATDATLIAAAAAAEGSVGRALRLLGGKALALQQKTSAMLEALPAIDPLALHALGDALAGNDRAALAVFVDTVDRWLGGQLQKPDPNANLPRLAKASEVWEKIGRAARDTETYNTERKPLVFSVFGLLAEVAH